MHVRRGNGSVLLLFVVIAVFGFLMIATFEKNKIRDSYRHIDEVSITDIDFDIETKLFDISVESDLFPDGLTISFPDRKGFETSDIVHLYYNDKTEQYSLWKKKEDNS